MDKRQLLTRLASDEEERLLLGRVWDKYDQCRGRNLPAATGFLSPREQAAAKRLLQALGAGDGWRLWGGYEAAERRQLHFLPDWQEEPEETAIRALRCRFYEGQTPNHRDFLGSLMGLGLTREKIGDILVAERSADVLVGETVVSFLLEQWTAAGRTALSVEEIPLDRLTVPPQACRVIRDTVSSLRLDSMVAAGFSTSRGKAAEAIQAGRVQVNWVVCCKPDRQVSQGDVLTVRGLGKCVVETVGGLSKKGRTGVTLKRFL